MFTGIITDVGQVLALDRQGDLRARIGTRYPVAGIDLGASIACDGVCLTVVALGTEPQGWFEVQISAESLSKTNIGDGNHSGWRIGSRVNLERALRVGDELGGHIVSGHVDGVAEIVAMQDQGDSTRLRFRAPAGFGRFLAPKGSVALNGTSLTVNEVEDQPDGSTIFGINVIPHTKSVTTWGTATVGDLVNFEIDTLARYIARLGQTGQTAWSAG